MDKFSTVLPSLMKAGGRVTWWNALIGSENFYGISDVVYDIYEVSPPMNNSYFNYSQYYLPKKQF